MTKLDKILHQIKLLRKEKGFTQAKFAEVLKVDRTTYVRKESGFVPLTLKEFLLIADFLKAQPEYFFKSIIAKSKRF